MKTITHPDKRFELISENGADQALIDALHLNYSVVVENFRRDQQQADKGCPIIGATLLVDRQSQRALVADSGSQALRALGDLFRLASAQGDHNGHVGTNTAHPQPHEALAAVLEEFKLVLQPLRDVVVEHKAVLEKMTGSHGDTPVVVEAAILTDTPPAIAQPWPAQGGIYLGIYRGEHLVVADATFTGNWGEYGQDVPGAKDRFDGRANTEAMRHAGCHIATQADWLAAAGQTDWFIPAQGQLTYAAAVAPEAFEPGYHWSSTQDSRSDAFVQDFEDGGSGWHNKDNEHRVRAFRGLPLHPLNTSAVQG